MYYIYYYLLLGNLLLKELIFIFLNIYIKKLKRKNRKENI